MPLYDMECKLCQLRFEVVADVDDNKMPCPQCEGKATRIPSIGRVNTVNDDAPWIRGAIKQMVDPYTTDPDERKMLNNPTRTNLNEYCKAKGLRALEPGENQSKKSVDYEAHAKTTAEKLFWRHKERKAVTVSA